jgi:hypothetical protein
MSMASTSALGIVDPGREAVFQQLGEVGARHDDALIDVETVGAEPGFLHQVGGGQAMHHALLQVGQQRQAFVFGQMGVEPGFERVAWQVQRGEHQPDGFVPGVVGAVAVEKSGLVEAADRPAQPVAEGDQFIGGAVDQLDISLSKVCS